MVAISFSVFKDKVLSGEKQQTIRPFSKHRWDSILRNRKLQLYWKLRTKETEFLKEVMVKEIFKIRFHVFWDDWTQECITILKETPDGWKEMNAEEQLSLAIQDGFDSVWSMLSWFENRYGKSLAEKEFMVIRW